MATELPAVASLTGLTFFSALVVVAVNLKSTLFSFRRAAPRSAMLAEEVFAPLNCLGGGLLCGNLTEVDPERFRIWEELRPRSS